MKSRVKYSPCYIAKMIRNSLEVFHLMRQCFPLGNEIGAVLLPDRILLRGEVILLNLLKAFFILFYDINNLVEV